MACRNCDKEFKTFFTACKICQLLDGDGSAKPTEYCNDCKSYICEPCWNNWIRRTKAFIKNIIT